MATIRKRGGNSYIEALQAAAEVIRGSYAD